MTPDAKIDFDNDPAYRGIHTRLWLARGASFGKAGRSLSMTPTFAANRARRIWLALRRLAERYHQRTPSGGAFKDGHA